MLNKNKRLNLVLVLLVVLGISSCQHVISVKSEWEAGKTVVDGNHVEWENELVDFELAGIKAGFRNDSDYLYICFCTEDSKLQERIKLEGMKVWIDYSGGQEKRKGIMILPQNGNFPRRLPEIKPDFKDDKIKTNRMMPTEEGLNELENSKAFWIPRDKEEPDRAFLEINSGSHGRFLVYEIKIPLVYSKSFSKILGVGFEISGRRGGPKGMPDKFPGGPNKMGGKPPMPQGSENIGKGMGPGRRPEGESETFEIWAKVSLVKEK